MKRTPPRAFTIIELLVVVTMIVLLMSMLTPAMEVAITQAKMAVCETRLKGIATGAVTYGLDFKNYFPNRPTIQAEGRQNKIHEPGGFDDRPHIAKYIAMEGLNDPMSGEVDLSVTEESLNSHVYSPYELWFGFGYTVTDADGQNPEVVDAMARVGDTWDWQGKAFKVIASDMYVCSVTEGFWINAAHPDKDNKFSMSVKQDRVEPWGNTTWSIYGHVAQKVRFSDRNFAYSDGSVFRLAGLRIRPGTAKPQVDERLTTVPYRTHARTPGPDTWSYVPRN